MQEMVQTNQKLRSELDQVTANSSSLLKTARTELMRKNDRLSELTKQFKCFLFARFGNHFILAIFLLQV